LLQAGNRRHPLDSIRLPSRSQQPVGAGRNHVFECAIHVFAHIKCAVKCDVQRARQLNQFAGLCSVDRIIPRQDSQDDSIRSTLLGLENVIPHDAQFLLRIHKVSASRPDDYKQLDIHCGPDRLDQPSAGSNASFTECAAKFNAFGSAIGGSHG
jgi:hypothetical protein